MYDATDNLPTADEIVAALRHLQDQRDELLSQRDLMEAERNELRRQIEGATEDALVIFSIDLPSGRDWAFIEDANVLAISPNLDEATKARLLAQVEPPKLITCDVCGAPYYSNAACGMHP